ncbi:MAG TPA: GAF domain-containing protein, partial [Rhodoferax sp.]
MKHAIHPNTQAATTVQPAAASVHEANFERCWLAILDALPDVLFEVDLQGRYLDYHSPRSDLLAIPADVFLGKTLHEVLSAAAADESMAALHEANVQGFSQGRRIQWVLPDSVRWFELSASRKDNGPGRPVSFLMLSRDVTERVATERKLQRMTQLYAALSQCNQAIVRCKTEAELYPSICRGAVNFGGMKMAWIASIDADRQQLVPVAYAGEGTDYLDGLVVTLDASSPNGRGPSGKAAREGQPYWCQDFLRDPSTAMWHERARQYGWGSSAALPLSRNGQVVGLLTVYSGEPDAFDEAAQNLLQEMAVDISYALDRFADELSRQQVQTKLRDSEERYRKAFETSPDAVNITRRADGMYLDVNVGFERLTGWRRDETVGKTSVALNLWANPKDRQRMVDALQKEGHCTNLEVDFVKKNGDIIHGLISAEPVQFDNVDCLLTITRDITEKKRAEAQIERLAHFDQLTGLPNRNQIQERFQFALSLAQRKGDSMAVMFLDLDHFK